MDPVAGHPEPKIWIYLPGTDQPLEVEVPQREAVIAWQTSLRAQTPYGTCAGI